MNSARFYSSIFGLFLSTAILHANSEITNSDVLHLTKTQHQIMQYTLETLGDLGLVTLNPDKTGISNPDLTDPRETLGVSKEAKKHWTILKLLEANTTGNTSNDHAAHLFGDRIHNVRMERRKQVNNIIAALNEVYHRILVNQSIVRNLGTLLIDFFNDNHVEHDCDERFQKNAKTFLALVNKTFSTPAFNLPFSSTDLQVLSLLHYYPDGFDHDHDSRPGEENPGGDGNDDVEDPTDDNFIYVPGTETYTLPKARTVRYIRSDDDAVGTLDLDKKQLTVTGEGKTFYGLLRAADISLEEAFSNVEGGFLLTDSEREDPDFDIAEHWDQLIQRGQLTLNGTTQYLDTAEGSYLSSLKILKGTLTLGQSRVGHLVATSVYVGENGVFELGSSDGEGEASLYSYYFANAGLLKLNKISSGEFSDISEVMNIGTVDVEPTMKGARLTGIHNVGTVHFKEGLESITVYDLSGPGLYLIDKDVTLTVETAIDLKEETKKEEYTLYFGKIPQIDDPSSIKIEGQGTLVLAADANHIEYASVQIENLIVRPDSSCQVDIKSFRINNTVHITGPYSTFFGNGNNFNCRSFLFDGGQLEFEPQMDSPNVSEFTLSIDEDFRQSLGTIFVSPNKKTTINTKTCHLQSGTFVLGYGDYADIETCYGHLNVEERLDTGAGSKINLGFVDYRDEGRDPNPSYFGRGSLTVNGMFCHHGGLVAFRVGDQGFSSNGLTGNGSIELFENTSFTVNLQEDQTFDGCIFGDGVLNLKADHPVTFTWPQRLLFHGTLNKDDSVTIVHSPIYNLNGFNLTLTGNDDDEELVITDPSLCVLEEEKTVKTLTSTAGQALYKDGLIDEELVGTLTVLSGSHGLDTKNGSKIQNLTLTNGDLTIGQDSSGFLNVKGALNIAAEAILRVGSEKGEGYINVTGSATNNGRIEILKTADGKPATFNDLNGNGIIHVELGAILALNKQGNYSGLFEGGGTLALASTSLDSFTIGSGTVGAMIVSTRVSLNQFSGADAFTITGELGIGITDLSYASGSWLSIGNNSPCSINCGSLSLRTSESTAYTLSLAHGSQLTCLGKTTHSAGYFDIEGDFVSQSYELTQGSIHVGLQNNGSMKVKDDFLLEWEVILGGDQSRVDLEGSVVNDGSGKLIVEGILRLQRGQILVHRLTDENSFVLGGLEGVGNITFVETNTQPMTINFTRDCEFTGRIEGPATIYLHADSPVTFKWNQRDRFEGTVEADDNVTIQTQ